MEIYGLIFLIVVGVLYGVSIRIVSVQGYDEMLLGHSFGDTPQAYIPNIYSLPSILAGIIVVVWVWTCWGSLWLARRHYGDFGLMPSGW